MKLDFSTFDKALASLNKGIQRSQAETNDEELRDAVHRLSSHHPELVSSGLGCGGDVVKRLAHDQVNFCAVHAPDIVLEILATPGSDRENRCASARGDERHTIMPGLEPAVRAAGPFRRHVQRRPHHRTRGGVALAAGDLDDLAFLFICDLNSGCPACRFHPPDECHAFNCSLSLNTG